VLAQIEVFGDLLEIRPLTPAADHKNQVTAAHLDGH
jgi:hypothetical protein